MLASVCRSNWLSLSLPYKLEENKGFASFFSICSLYWVLDKGCQKRERNSVKSIIHNELF